MLNLTQQQRERFVEWLEREFSRREGIVAQMDKLGMDKKLRADATAEKVVVDKLRSEVID